MSADLEIQSSLVSFFAVCSCVFFHVIRAKMSKNCRNFDLGYFSILESILKQISKAIPKQILKVTCKQILEAISEATPKDIPKAIFKEIFEVIFRPIYDASHTRNCKFTSF